MAVRARDYRLRVAAGLDALEAHHPGGQRTARDERET
jgi:hypothetical protein